MQVMSQGQITIPLVREQVSLAFQRSILALPFEYVISVVCVASCWFDRVVQSTHIAPTLAVNTSIGRLLSCPRLCVCVSRPLSHYVCGQTGLWSNR